MKQIDDVGGKFQMMEEGWYRVMVEDVPKKFKTGHSHYRKWKFRLTESNKSISITLFPWEQKDLLLALDGIEKDGKIEWDDEEVVGKQIMIFLHSPEDKMGKKWQKIKDARKEEILYDDFIDMDEG